MCVCNDHPDHYIYNDHPAGRGWQHRGEFRSQTKPLLYEELATYFCVSADEAAERLGVCMSAIKKICRRHGIIRCADESRD